MLLIFNGNVLSAQLCETWKNWFSESSLLNSKALFISIQSFPSITQVIQHPLFGEVSKSMQKIVKPKNPQQTSFTPKSDLKHVINPASTSVFIGNVKNTHDRGIVIGSSQLDGIKQLKQIIEREMFPKYEVQLLKSVRQQGVSSD